MKSSKFLISAAVVAMLLPVGCKKAAIYEGKTGIDSSKAGVEDFYYDEDASGKTSIALYWDVTKAIKAGATSFSVQLAKNEDFTDIDMYNSAIGQTLQASSAKNDAVVMSPLKENDRYFARIRANYPKSIYSDWTYLTQNGKKICISVGHGVVTMEFIAPEDLEANVKNYSEATVSWSVIGPADAYQVEWKKSSDTIWEKGEKTANYEYKITGLEELTKYDFRVRAFAGEEATEYSEIASFTTPQKPPFDNNINSPELLLQFFSEIVDQTGSSEVFTLEKDIDMAGLSFVGAGTFKGNFDGKGHKIMNLTSDTPLFLENEGTIKNLIIDESCTFNVNDQTFGALVKTNKESGVIEGVENHANVELISGASLTGGVALGGIIGLNYGTLTNVKNYGNVTFNVNGTSESFGIAGVAAFTSGAAKGCVNEGTISCSLERVSKKIRICSGMTADGTGCLGGVFCYGGKGMTIDTCNNSGEISYNVTKIDSGTNGIERNQIAGVMAAPYGMVSNCTNTGKITVKAITSTGATYSTASYIVGVGGISGGDYFSSESGDAKQNVTNIDKCKNEGDIDVTFDASSSNSTVGGIVGWPGIEAAAQTIVISNCENKGNITVSGTGKGRFGGVSGGSGNLKGCKNYGRITNKTSVSGSCVGGVNGYRNYAMTIEDCENYGDVENEHGDLVYTGGLIGAWGGQDFNSGAGCVCKCNLIIKGDDEGKIKNFTGIILGNYNGDKNDILGSAEKPIKVNGSVTINGAKTDLTDSNFKDYLCGKYRGAVSFNDSDPSCKRQVYVVYEQ